MIPNEIAAGGGERSNFAISEHAEIERGWQGVEETGRDWKRLAEIITSWQRFEEDDRD